MIPACLDCFIIGAIYVATFVAIGYYLLCGK